MAFGARELRLILSIQSYGTSNFARLRKDISSLERAAKAANMNQAAVQHAMLRDAEKLARTRDRIATMEQAAINKRAALQNRASRAEMTFAQRRRNLGLRELALADTVAGKRLQIANTVGRLEAMHTSSRSKAAFAENDLATKRIQLQNKLGAIERTGIGLQAQRLRARATESAAFRKFAAAAGGAAAATSLGADMSKLEGANARIKEAGFRWKAIKLDQQKINAAIGAQEGEIAAVNSQLERTLIQEDLISQQKVEQAAAIGRQADLIGLQSSQLATIEARMAGIAEEIAAIDKAEALVNTELADQLAILNEENVTLERQKILATEIGATIKRNGSIRMAEAGAMDAAMMKQQRLQKLETKQRTFAHAGRTAQFTGLIGTAGFLLAANSAAKFGSSLTLAATQARDINAPLSQVAERTTQIEHGFDRGGKHIKGVLDLMNEYPATAEEMTKATYDIFSSMQVSFGGGLGLLEKFNQLAVATGGDLVTATNAGITVLNNFNHEGQTTNQTLNTMVAIIRFGRLHLTEFNQMLNKVAPAAKIAGQSLRDVSGAMAFLTTRMPSQPQAATGIARLLQTFRDPDFQKGVFKVSKGMVDITKGAGAVGALKPLPVILNQMAGSFKLFSRFGGANQLFKELTSTGKGSGQGRQSRIEAANAYALLIGQIKQYNALQKLVTGDTSEFSTALKAMSASPGVRWQVFINQMHALVLTIGETALPVFLKLAGYLQQAAHWFENLSKGTRDLIVKFGVIGSVGLLLGGTILSIASNFAVFVTNARLARLSMAATGTEAEAAAVKVGVLDVAMKGLMGIGIIAIPIVMQLIKGGEPGLWMLLGAAAAGAAGGFLLGGPAGALAGAFTIPIIVEVIAEFQKKPKDAAHQAYDEYARAIRGSQHYAGVGSGLINKAFDFCHAERCHVLQGVVEVSHSVHDEEEKSLTKEQQFQKQYNKYLRAFNKDLLNNMTDQQKALQAAYDDQTNKTNKRHQNELALAKAHANAMQAAQANMNNKINTLVDKLASIYDDMIQKNKEALGSVGQGPVMQGILGNIFSGLNDTLRQFGVQIPVPSRFSGKT